MRTPFFRDAEFTAAPRYLGQVSIKERGQNLGRCAAPYLLSIRLIHFLLASRNTHHTALMIWSIFRNV